MQYTQFELAGLPSEECLLDMERERVMPAFDTLWKNLASEVEQGWAYWQLSWLFCRFA